MVPSPNFNQSYIQLGCAILLRGITPPTDGLGPKALVYTNNKIRMCVCLFVCSFDEHLLLGKSVKGDILYMVGSGIYREVFLSIFQLRLTNRPDAIGR